MRWPTKREYGDKVVYPSVPREFTISVENHVRGSVVGEEESCAAARALCDQPGVAHVWVKASRTALLMEDGTVEVYVNPRRLENGIRLFDATAGLFPGGDYKLLPLPYSVTTEARRRRANYNTNHEAKRGNPRRRRPTHQFR